MTTPPFVAVTCQHDHVGDNDPPPDPSLKALQPLIGTACQLHGPAHHANAPFNAIPKPLALLKPGLLFVRAALRSFGAGLRNGNLFNAQALRQAFIGGREQALVPSQHPGGVLKAVAMAVQDLRQQLLIWGIARGNELPVAKEPAFHFGVVDLMPELRLPRAGFAPANDLGMGFTEAHHLLVRRECLVVQHAPDRLPNSLFD
jgi:hypothetical protein